MNHIVTDDKLDTEELMDTREGTCQVDFRVPIGFRCEL